jgi:hypothetical protein
MLRSATQLHRSKKSLAAMIQDSLSIVNQCITAFISTKNMSLSMPLDSGALKEYADQLAIAKDLVKKVNICQQACMSSSKDGLNNYGAYIAKLQEARNKMLKIDGFERQVTEWGFSIPNDVCDLISSIRESYDSLSWENIDPDTTFHVDQLPVHIVEFTKSIEGWEEDLARFSTPTCDSEFNSTMSRSDKLANLMLIAYSVMIDPRKERGRGRNSVAQTLYHAGCITEPEIELAKLSIHKHTDHKNREIKSDIFFVTSKKSKTWTYKLNDAGMLRVSQITRDCKNFEDLSNRITVAQNEYYRISRKNRRLVRLSENNSDIDTDKAS